ncbi:MAG TPA: hypothetical protein VLB47_01175, partial [Solirubrobacteraceae bacterium]|nr:hypothetical protein [Solirubrobacteraceae bacterium]
DEGTGTALGATDLVRRPDSGGGLMLWDNAADNGGTPLSVDVTAGRIGVRVALAGGTSTACGDPLVECYDMGSANGLGLIRGWSADPAVGDKDAPRARSVALTPGTCGDAYFNAGPACAIGISAQVDFQGGVPAADRSVTAVVGGTSHPLTRDAATGRWLGGGIAIPAYSGPNDIALRWEQTSGTVGSNGCKSGGGNKCKGDLGVVHRTFSATPARSGPIQLLTVGDQYSPTGANDVQRCSASNATCRHDFVVQIGIAGNLKVDGPGDPPKVLRVGGGGSQNQTIDCDPAISQFKDEIAQGCTPEYQRNTGQACPSPNVFGTPQPWYCVSTQTGAAVNQVPAGLNMRILGSEKPASCTAPNNWPDYQPGDPRIVPLYIVPFGAFQGAGNQTFPVQDFAFFYVTGWTGQGGGFDNPCQGNGDDPVPGNDPGSIVGHFIRYIQTPNTGGGGDQPCDFDQDSISGCIAVLTR